MDLLDKELEDLDIEEVINLFRPAIEITDAIHFAGRRTEIEECAEGLMQQGAMIVLYGQRGVGKTSIANQICNIANNDVSLLKKQRITHLVPKRGFRFRVLKYELDTSVVDIHDLIGRIVYGDKLNNGLLSLVQDGGKKQTSETDELELSGEGGIKGFFNLKGGEKVKKEYEIDDSSDLIIKFKRLLDEIEHNDSTGKKLLIIIDEFDLVENKKGIASLIKACSKKYVKFVLVGVASSISELIVDHASISRKKIPVHVDLMEPQEIEQILIDAENNIGGKMRFSPEVRTQIVDLSEGFPFYAQLIGLQTMLSAFKHGRKIIIQDDLDNFFDRLEAHQLDAIYCDMYECLFRDKNQRRDIVHLAASIRSEIVVVDDVLTLDPLLKRKTVQRELNALTRNQEGHQSVLIKLRPNNYRFVDPLFKTYCRLVYLNERRKRFA